MPAATTKGEGDSIGHKLNNLPAGVLLGAMLTGLPIWAYAEKKIEQRTTITNTVSNLKARVESIENKQREDNATLHRRLSETSKTLGDKLEAQSGFNMEAREDILGRLWTIENALKQAEINLAVLQATRADK